MAATYSKESVERVVRASLAPVPVSSVDVVQGHDHDDDEALFITVNLPEGTPLVGEKFNAAIVAVSGLLLDAGDERIPYVHLHHLGEPAPDEGERFAVSPR